MYIEILESYIKVNNGNIKGSILPFLNIKSQNILKGYNNLESNQVYLNDNIIAIKKNTLQLEAIGCIVNIDKNKICISKRGNNSCIYIEKDYYYLFIKKTKNKNNDRMFYQELLKVM
tara:strand:- start:374 stop:724 length:351 start_codon:yes stop_codon:yes gene_type:complete